MIRAGIDVGGTKAIVALVDENMRVVARTRLATGQGACCKEVMRECAAQLQALLMARGLDLKDLPGVGIGVPGTVDETASVVVNAPNLGWHNEEAAALFKAHSGILPRLLQDTRAAALAESHTPQMRDKKVIACVTLGTGVGCGIVQNGVVFHGGMGTAGEIGHIPVVPQGRECACGRRGCMEAYASGTGILKTARERGIADSPQEVFAKAAARDAAALLLLEEAVELGAMGVSAMINSLSPDAVLFSGGLSAQRALYLDPLIQRIRALAYKPAVTGAAYMGPALLGEDAPVIGAALLT